MLRSNATIRPVRRLPRTLLRFALGVVLTVVLLELCLRIAHLGRAPLVPFVIGEGGIPSLPAGMDQTIAFGAQPPTRYIVDDWGARIARPGLAGRHPSGGVLVVGDSQALGYQIPFEQTFAAEIAGALCGRADAARILASPAIDPEQELGSVSSYVIGLPRQKLAILTLNMANDLDEMFFGGEGARGAAQSPLQNFLICHSFAYMDWANLYEHYLRPSPGPPGMNLILSATSSDERLVLADQTVRVLMEMARSIPAGKTIVVIVPNKYQVNVSLFRDFRRCYRSQEDFDQWNARAPDAADQMNAIETYIAARLRAANIPVIRFTDLARSSGAPPAELFETTSEHITARAHRLIADAIVGAKT